MKSFVIIELFLFSGKLEHMGIEGRRLIMWERETTLLAGLLCKEHRKVRSLFFLTCVSILLERLAHAYSPCARRQWRLHVRAGSLVAAVAACGAAEVVCFLLLLLRYCLWMLLRWHKITFCVHNFTSICLQHNGGSCVFPLAVAIMAQNSFFQTSGCNL